MEAVDSIKPDDKVMVAIYGPDGSRLYQTEGTGYHKIGEAINDAVSNANLEINPEDCVFEVANESTSVTHRYRFNAHGNLKLII